LLRKEHQASSMDSTDQIRIQNNACGTWIFCAKERPGIFPLLEIITDTLDRGCRYILIEVMKKPRKI
ncbi:hypothetical protein RFY41_07235, partial [Acinetobacter soli]|uniref:hypothetical protein n=1 Tax=Acinetobacter soli TaxID=487316 RepID=UPI002813B7E1